MDREELAAWFAVVGGVIGMASVVMSCNAVMEVAAQMMEMGVM